MDTKNIAAKLASKIERQKAALQDTKEEQTLLEKIAAQNPDGNFTNARSILAARRLRQHNALLATEQYLAALTRLGSKK